MSPTTKYWLVLVSACAAVNVVFYTFDSGIRNKRVITTRVGLKYSLEKSGGGVTPYIITYQTGIQPTLRPTRSYNHPVRRLKNIDRVPESAIIDKSDNRVFNFKMNRRSSCPFNVSDLTVIVVSKLDNFLRRSAIRNTWASLASAYNSTVVFLIGSTDSRPLQLQVEREEKLYGDIIQVERSDSYKLLTYKSIAMLQWLNDYCYQSKYFLKTDDDMYINIPNLFQSLKGVVKTITSDRFFLCHVFKEAPPIRDVYSKWYTSYEEYGRHFFPTYCSGTAYLFTSTVLTELYQSSLKTTFLTMEDVFITGLSAENLGIKHIHDDRFSYEKRESTGCSFRNAISGHDVTVKDMFVIFAQLYNNEIDCETKENLVIKNAEEYD